MFTAQGWRSDSKERRFKMRKFILVFLMIFIFTPLSFCQEAGKIVSAQGRVDIFKEGSQEAVPAIGDDLISVGDSIRTKSGSKALVFFRDKSVLKLAQNSKVLIKDYQLDDRERRVSAVIELSRGKARVIIAKTPSGASFVIKTPNTEGTVKGSDVTAFYQAGNSGMFVSEGKMSVINLAHPDKDITVPAGNACAVLEQDLPKGPRPYMELEKKMHEDDTNISIPFSKISNVSGIKGMVSKTSGKVKILNKGSNAPHDAKISDILGEGDSVETGDKGYIEIRLDNNNAIYPKPNTKLSIITLLLNPATGEFENIFEVTIGNVKARIEGLKDRSKFEVKTPTAVCGARGTIMYVMVNQDNTISFFEGGNGYMTNTLSGVTQNIGAGQSSASGYTGSVTIPVYVSDDERQSYGEGWDGAAGVEGYSASGGEGGAELFGAGNVLGIGPVDTGEGEQKPVYYFVNVPFSEVVNNLSSSNTQAANFLCRFGEVTEEADRTVMSESKGSSVDGYFMFSLPSTPDWVGNSNYSYVAGSYSNPDNKTFWTGNIEAGASDGGAYKGWIGGRFLNSNGTNKVDGKIFCIYIDPAGNGGIFSSYFSDGIYGSGVFTATSDSVDFLKRKTSLGVSPQDLFTATMDETRLEAAGSGRFFSRVAMGGIIDCLSLGGTGLSLNGEKWGIWHIEAKGMYGGITSNDWSLALGGKIINSDDGESYWLGTMSSSDKKDSRWENGGLMNAFKGVYIDKDSSTGIIRAGIIENGDILGYYSPDNVGEDNGNYDGNWQAIGGGEWVEISELLNERDLSFTYDQLENFVRVPITEVYSNALIGSNNFINNSATMNISLYQNAELVRIWTSLISGTYSGSPADPNNWNLTFGQSGSDIVNLTNGTWTDGLWKANVNGSVHDNSITGQAAGTYTGTDSGTFTGVGAGTWSQSS